jgi:hypothetical protein
MEWEKAANPEIEWLKKKYEPSTDFENKKTVVAIMNIFTEAKGIKRDPTQFTESMISLGYVIHYGVIKNIVGRKPPALKQTDTN